jgi:hypothetical protein
MAEEQPNQGATGEAPEIASAEPAGDPSAERTGESGPADAGASINQGAPGTAPASAGRSPLSAQPEVSLVDERPELLVGAAFVGGFALAQILKRLGDS